MLSAPAWAQKPVLVPQVHAAVDTGDFVTAGKLLDAYRESLGVTPEYIEALSWIGRAELKLSHAEAASENAAEVRKLCEEQLTRRKLDAEGHLPTALGASIEVQANALVLQGQRDQAVSLLQNEIKRWGATSILMRLQKNLNLLTLEGKPVPNLDLAQWIGDKRPLPLTSHRGHPVLLFLWAHWCPDCKAEVAVIERLQAAYRSRGLVVVAPTRFYGFVAGGMEADPEVEKRYITDVFAKYYVSLGSMEMPLSEENFRRFGVSTTPTMVVIDGKGIVRMYNPGAASYEALAARIEPLLGPASGTSK
jgi:thiol-disulfide isomerase/thioredoxin